jgi:nucleotide-binding universal stress UspA family protein
MMIRITNILCPTDFSLHAQAALPIACALARDYGAKLILLHVRPVQVTAMGEFGAIPPDPREPEETLKAKIRQSMPANFAGIVECLVQDGDVTEEILKTAQQWRCDVIVLATHGRSGLRRVLLGSVAEAVLRKAPCPVLTIKPTAPTQSIASGVGDGTEAEPNLDANDLATVCSVANPMEAEVLRNALKSENIPCFVEGIQQAGIVGTMGIPIKVQVRVSDFNRADKFIQTHQARHH